MRSFFYFQNGFRSSRSSADLLTVLFDRIARTFHRSEATHAVAFHISKAFGRVLVFFTNLKSYRISGQLFGFISSFLSNR